ncbi:ABC transporter ATP-binding protein [Salinicoccus sp. RF5]|uniref:ABC transporter ATP-binding protein n=1 Tax=Salinicoccus sp. RF5 TaxID=2748874 RepID=UPI001E2E4E7B|nr:ABC transporter ATP-binding protein [Salinicoccus sp. RF5]MCC4722397.1 ABC transporter ATP-binding protein [Salinicoccus sp. RF5]
MTNKLEVHNLTHTFNGGNTVHVLDDLSLDVADGEFVTLLGPSGSGKSTIFNLIGGLYRPDSGDIFIDGTRVNGTRGNISYLPQQDSLLPWRTIEDNVTLVQEITGTVDKDTARKWLKRAGLEGYEKAYPSTLSGGMRQRVAFIRSLLSPQELMLLDEPFGALDELTRLDMQDWLLKIWEMDRRSVLFITHSIEEAIYMSNRILILSDKPARIAREIEVPFERPRNHDIILDESFTKLKREIYHMLRAGDD